MQEDKSYFTVITREGADIVKEVDCCTTIITDEDGKLYSEKTEVIAVRTFTEVVPNDSEPA